MVINPFRNLHFTNTWGWVSLLNPQFHFIQIHKIVIQCYLGAAVNFKVWISILKNKFVWSWKSFKKNSDLHGANKKLWRESNDVSLQIKMPFMIMGMKKTLNLFFYYINNYH